MYYGPNKGDRLYINIGDINARLRKFCKLHLLSPKIYRKLPLHVVSSATSQEATWANIDQNQSLTILV
jgi:hypothetical protein